MEIGLPRVVRSWRTGTPSLPGLVNEGLGQCVKARSEPDPGRLEAPPASFDVES
jgi:hypothetical protein